MGNSCELMENLAEPKNNLHRSINNHKIVLDEINESNYQIIHFNFKLEDTTHILIKYIQHLIIALYRLFSPVRSSPACVLKYLYKESN